MMSRLLRTREFLRSEVSEISGNSQAGGWGEQVTSTLHPSPFRQGEQIRRASRSEDRD